MRNINVLSGDKILVGREGEHTSEGHDDNPSICMPRTISQSKVTVFPHHF